MAAGDSRSGRLRVQGELVLGRQVEQVAILDGAALEGNVGEDQPARALVGDERPTIEARDVGDLDGELAVLRGGTGEPASSTGCRLCRRAYVGQRRRHQLGGDAVAGCRPRHRRAAAGGGDRCGDGNPRLEPQRVLLRGPWPAQRSGGDAGRVSRRGVLAVAASPTRRALWTASTCSRRTWGSPSALA